jgi:hypothetical protein
MLKTATIATAALPSVCKPTPRHRTELVVTRHDHLSQNDEQQGAITCGKRYTSTRILELENLCAGNRTVGSNPTLSAKCLGLSGVRQEGAFVSKEENLLCRYYP